MNTTEELIKALHALVTEGEEGTLVERGWDELHALTEPLQLACDHVEAARIAAASKRRESLPPERN